MFQQDWLEIISRPKVITLIAYTSAPAQ